MVKSLWILAVLFAVSCNNNGNGNDNTSTSDTEAPDSPTTQYRGVENVIGNIPDTINTGAEPQSNYGSDTAIKN